MKQRQTQQAVLRTLALSLALCGQSQWAYAGIAQTPLFLASQPRPNIMYTLDDSGSMDWPCIPDAVCPITNRGAVIDFLDPRNWGVLVNVNSSLKLWSVQYNAIAYDPNVLYKPWMKSDRTYMQNSDPSAARVHPMYGNTLNLIDS